MIDLNEIVFEKIPDSLHERIYFRGGQSVLGSGDLSLIESKDYAFMSKEIVASQIIKPAMDEFFSRFPLKHGPHSLTVAIDTSKIPVPELLKPWVIGITDPNTGNQFGTAIGFGYFGNYYNRYGWISGVNGAMPAANIPISLSGLQVSGSLQPFVSLSYDPLEQVVLAKSTSGPIILEYWWAFRSYNVDHIKPSRYNEFVDYCSNLFLIHLANLRSMVEDDAAVKFTMDSIKGEALEANKVIIEAWNANANAVFARL